MICKMGNFLKAYEKNFKRKKNGNDADLGSIYRKDVSCLILN